MRTQVLEGLSRVLLVAIVIIVLATMVLACPSSGFGGEGRATTNAHPTITLSLTPAPSPTVTPRPTLTPSIPRIGLIAGHWQNDPGAVCSDGLREVDVNVAVAQQVQARLVELGYTVNLFPEFSPDLSGYAALAFVAIHSDSCIDEPSATGFKVARVSQSAVPETEDRLVACLYNEYERATGLARHDSSITSAMREYHALRQIAPETPGVIIELGFLFNDRAILVHGRDRAADGVANGILCFLNDPHRFPLPTPTPP
jgi:N-acetylmuramoyl-L-alanine amidase